MAPILGGKRDLNIRAYSPFPSRGLAEEPDARKTVPNPLRDNAHGAAGNLDHSLDHKATKNWREGTLQRSRTNPYVLPGGCTIVSRLPESVKL